MKVYTLWTFGAGTQHVVTDKATAERWKRSNPWRGFTEWEPDSDLADVIWNIELEAGKSRTPPAVAQARE